VTSNRVYKKWPEIFNNDSTLTSALLDRLLHHAETVIIEGPSYRAKDQVQPSGSASGCVHEPCGIDRPAPAGSCALPDSYEQQRRAAAALAVPPPNAGASDALRRNSQLITRCLTEKTVRTPFSGERR
jgi:hypothetical protein